MIYMGVYAIPEYASWRNRTEKLKDSCKNKDGERIKIAGAVIKQTGILWVGCKVLMTGMANRRRLLHDRHLAEASRGETGEAAVFAGRECATSGHARAAGHAARHHAPARHP